MEGKVLLLRARSVPLDGEHHLDDHGLYTFPSDAMG